MVEQKSSHYMVGKQSSKWRTAWLSQSNTFGTSRLLPPEESLIHAESSHITQRDVTERTLHLF